MSRSWCAWVLSGLLAVNSPSFGYQESHQDPHHFAAGVLDGKLEIETEGGIELGSGRFHHHPKTQISDELRSPSFAGFLGIPATRFEGTGQPGLRMPVVAGLGQDQFHFVPPKTSELFDSEWFEGNLHVLLRPKTGSPTSSHLYRMKMKPNGEIGGPELYALAPPGHILSRIAKIENRMFAVSRLAGEPHYRLLELRTLNSRTGGWIDFGPAPVNEYSVWDLTSSGETLLLLSPQSRQVIHSGIPSPNKFNFWERTTLGGGSWVSAISQLLESLESNRDDSAVVTNEFSLPHQGGLETLSLEILGSRTPKLRYRVAQAQDEWFSDWTQPVTGRLFPLDQPGQVIQYQLIQEAAAKPVTVSEVNLNWHLQDSPPNKRWHFSQSQPLKKQSRIDELFRKNWKAWHSPSSPSNSWVAKAGAVTGKVGSQTASLTPSTGGQETKPEDADAVTSPFLEAKSETQASDSRTNDEMEEGLSDQGAEDTLVQSSLVPRDDDRGNTLQDDSQTDSTLTSALPGESPEEDAPHHVSKQPQESPDGEMHSGSGEEGPSSLAAGVRSGIEESRDPMNPGHSTPDPAGKILAMNSARPSGNGGGGGLEEGGRSNSSGSPSRGDGLSPEFDSGVGNEEEEDPSLTGSPQMTRSQNSSPEKNKPNTEEGGQADKPESGSGLQNTAQSTTPPDAAMAKAGNEATPVETSLGDGAPDGAAGPEDQTSSAGVPKNAQSLTPPLEESPRHKNSRRVGPVASQEEMNGGLSDRSEYRAEQVLARLLPDRFGPRGNPIATGGSLNRSQEGSDNESSFLGSVSQLIKRWVTDHPALLVWILWALLLLLTELVHRLLKKRGWNADSPPPFLQPSEVNLIDWERARQEQTAAQNRISAKSVSKGNPGEELEPVAVELPNQPEPTSKVDWTVADPLPQPMASASAFYRNGQVYVVDPHGTICSARINADGSLKPWYVRMGHLPAQAGAGSVAVLEDHVVCQVGPNLYSAVVDERGIGSWVDSGRVEGLTGKTTMFGNGNRIYFVGGHGEQGKLPLVRSAIISVEAGISDLIDHPALPVGIREAGCAVEGGRLYLVGGRSGNQISSLVLSAPIDKRGCPGVWRMEAEMPSSMRRPIVQSWKGSLWVIGGGNGQSTKTIVTGKIGRDGIIQGWQKVPSDLPEPVTEGTATRAGGRFLLMGGRDARDYGKTLTDVYWLEPRLG